jgi:ABC-type amino acid transport substrate-binding protein
LPIANSKPTFKFMRAAAMCLLFFRLASPPAAHASAQDRIVYYGQDTGPPAETSFPFQVLKLGLSKTGVSYVLKPSPIGKANSERIAERMIADGPIDVQWIAANIVDDQKMSPVLFPIDMGLLGYRVFLIEGSRQKEFAQIKTIGDLRKMVALQGAGWADVDVLRSAGLRVRTAPSYTDLFRMTTSGRADYFPRGAFEAYNEKLKFAREAPGLEVEDTLVLHYPFSFIFYVKKTDTQLRTDLYRGLVAAFDDGSFKALFLSNPNVQTVMTNAHLNTRRVIEIDNPYISAEMKAVDKRYWYQP